LESEVGRTGSLDPWVALGEQLSAFPETSGFDGAICSTNPTTGNLHLDHTSRWCRIVGRLNPTSGLGQSNEYRHHIREEWGFADEDGPTLAGLFRQQYRGSRYSWGYPACPDLDDQLKVAELLEIDRIGVSLTEEFHLVPEQSTSAIIVPHPEAKYFITR